MSVSFNINLSFPLRPLYLFLVLLCGHQTAVAYQAGAHGWAAFYVFLALVCAQGYIDGRGKVVAFRKKATKCTFIWGFDREDA